MITVVKQNARGETTIQYQGEFVERSPYTIIVQAYWTRPEMDLGYTRIEPGDCFTEHFYSDHWFNIFEIVSATGIHKGWYCNVAEPAIIFDDRIEQVDLLLDVWVNPTGKPLILDEDEFVADATLSDEQRRGARQGLQELLQMLADRQEAFATIRV